MPIYSYYFLIFCVLPYKMSYSIVPIIGDGNCLFRAVSYCMYNTQEKHRQIRLQAVNQVAQDWSRYSDFIIGDSTYRMTIRNASDYSFLMSRDGTYGGDVELASMGSIFTDSLFRVHRIVRGNLKPIADYGSGHRICNLLYSGSFDYGHYSVIAFRSNTLNRSDIGSTSTKRRPSSYRH